MTLKNFRSSSFLTRLLSGILLVVIALATIIAGGNVLFVTLLLVSMAGVYELYRVFKIDRSPAGFAGYAAVIAYYILLRAGFSPYFVIFFVIFLMCLMALYVFMYPRISAREVESALFGMVYCAVMLSFIYMIRQDDGGAINVWLVFLASWGSDTCAYVAGMAFGKHPMTPRLSPKKTVEGAVGGVIGAGLLGLIYAVIFKDAVSAAVDIRIAYPIICVLGALVSMVGDLAASAIKRNYEVKDYGKLIPGHGGIMDRFDSVIFVAPLIWLLFLFF